MGQVLHGSARTTEAGAVLVEKPLLSDGLTVAIRRLIDRPERLN